MKTLGSIPMTRNGRKKGGREGQRERREGRERKGKAVRKPAAYYNVLK